MRASIASAAVELIRPLESVQLASLMIQPPPVGAVARAAAFVALGSGDHEDAARAAGAADGWLQRLLAEEADNHRARHAQQRLEPARAALGDRYDELYAEGAELPDPAVLDLAEAIARRSLEPST